MCNNIVEEQAAAGKKENGDSVVHHRRSRRCNFSTEIIVVIFSVMNMLSKSECLFILFWCLFIYLW